MSVLSRFGGWLQMTTQVHAHAPPHVPVSALACGAAGGSSTVRNRLLGMLRPRALAELDGELEHLDLASGHILHEPHAPIDYVYFPDTCVASMVRRMDDGSGIEVGIIGCEGVSGVSIVLGATSMPTQCLIQVPGAARRMPAAALHAALKRASMKTSDGRSLTSVLLLFAQALFEQVAQSAACNRLHSLEQRCARWLLMTHDRTAGDELALTQEFLSYMLGVRRAGVTEAAGSLQRSGLINYRHGRIRIRDREGLEAVACECYSVGVQAYRTLLDAPETA